MPCRMMFRGANDLFAALETVRIAGGVITDHWAIADHLSTLRQYEVVLWAPPSWWPGLKLTGWSA